jgi:DNA-3-methyladenine glycosylase II
LSHQKVDTIRVLAQHADDGLLNPGRLATMTDVEVQAKLEALPGLRPSSAQRFLLYYLHRPDVFLVNDLTAREAITALADCIVQLEMVVPEQAARPHPVEKGVT